MSWVPERPKPVIPEGLPELPDAFRYIWPEEDDCVFLIHYTPSTPRWATGEYSVPIFTEQQMFEYATRAVAARMPSNV